MTKSKTDKLDEFDEAEFDEQMDLDQALAAERAERAERAEPPKPRDRVEEKSRPQFPPIEILFQDEHVVVINKPAGLDSTRGQFSEVSVLDVLEEKIADLPGPLRLVHRLDRQTTGLMILAKTLEAQRNLSGQWETRSVEKTYRVIVHGVMETAEGKIDLPLKKIDHAARPVIIDHKKGKPAVTEYKVLEQFRQFALVQAHPITGRMHQIRVHFAALGCSVLGDKHYGLPEPLYLSQFKRGYKHSHRKEKERSLIARLALHADRLKFKHPTTGAEMEFKLDPPRDFAAAVKQLSKYGR